MLAPVSWGTTYLTVTELLPADHPLMVAALRVLPAGVALSLFGRITSRWRPIGRQWSDLTLLALFNFAIFFPLLITAVYRLPGGVAASMGGLQPLLVATVSRLVLRQRLRRLDAVVGVAAVIGVSLVVLRPGAAFDPIGLLAAVGANVSFSIGVVLTKALPPPGNRLASTGWQLLLSALVLVPLALVVEGIPPIPSARNVAGFAYLSLAATGGAFALWFNGIRRLPIQAPPLLGLAAPITGAALGWIVLNEALSTSQLAGFVITISAISYGATVGSRGVRSEPPRVTGRYVAGVKAARGGSPLQ